MGSQMWRKYLVTYDWKQNDWKNKLQNGVSDLSAMDALAAQNPLEIFYRAPEDDVNFSKLNGSAVS